ncbi:MAG: ketopantoate reductase family protein [Rhodospirillales bacterium]|nr:ketopantoate reductase family protein [Rhodospirillales bacterium]
MKICILGAGSLGSTFGVMLAEAGNDVSLVNRNQAHVDAINSNGLVVRHDGKDRAVSIPAVTTTETLLPVDLVIVLVKSAQTSAAIASARNVIGPHTTVMSIQNGLGHEDKLSEVAGRASVVAGKTYVGGLLLGPGHVLAEARGRETIIGELDGSRSERIMAIAETFTNAGLQTNVSKNIMGAMWDKLLVNVATGALSGITGLAYGNLYAVPEIEACALAAVREAMTVARAAGVTLTMTDPREPWVKAAQGLPDEFKASMLQSLEKGATTEVDFINGAVVRAGRKVGVPTPVNDTLVACIKGIERGLTK